MLYNIASKWEISQESRAESTLRGIPLEVFFSRWGSIYRSQKSVRQVCKACAWLKRVVHYFESDLIGLDRIKSDQTLYRGTSCAVVRIGSNRTVVVPRARHVVQSNSAIVAERKRKPIDRSISCDSFLTMGGN